MCKDEALRGEPYVWVAPSRKVGQPCVGGTRIPTALVADAVLSGASYEDTVEMWHLTRRAVLIACWYEATHSRHKRFRRAWSDWAKDAGETLWKTDGPLPGDPALNDAEKDRLAYKAGLKPKPFG